MARLSHSTALPQQAAPARVLQWVNSPVLLEAIARYERGDLPRSLRLWIEGLLELEPGPSGSGPLRARRH